MGEIILRLKPDLQTIDFNGNKMCLKISAKANNGLSFVNGKLIATKAPDGTPGSGGTMNTPGNALGPITATESTYLQTIGFNSSVSRHKKYTGADTFLQDNDGPVMTNNYNGEMVPNGSIATYMIALAGGV